MKEYEVKSIETITQIYKQKIFAKGEKEAEEKADNGDWGEPITSYTDEQYLEVNEINERANA
jgi:hypothetical protein